FSTARARESRGEATARKQPLSPPELVAWAERAGMLDPGAAPNVVNFSFDRSCNLACGYCREELFRPNAAERNLIATIDANIFAGSLDGTERIILLGEGDPFASPIYRDKLRQYDWSRHPALRIKIQSNGLLLTPAMWDSIAASHGATDWISISGG